MTAESAPTVSALDAALEAYARAARGAFTERLRAAEAVHAALAHGPVVPVVRTLRLFAAPAPTRDVLGPIARALPPFVALGFRGHVVQCFERGAVRTVLWNPLEATRVLRTPSFATLTHGAGRVARAVVLRAQPGVDSQLGLLGLSPDAVDAVAFATLDAVDPSAVLARYPRARLVVPRDEWTRWREPTDADRPWLARGHEVDMARVQLFDGACSPGEGVALLVTGGRRAAHVALALRSAAGVLVGSGNAFAPDGYAPHASRFAALDRYARARGLQFVPAFPALGGVGAGERAMTLEHALADRMPGSPVFPFVQPLHEIERSIIAPGFADVQPSGALALGTVLAERTSD